MNDVNNKQIGGNHYRAPIQHWDFVEYNGIGYLEGCATKYATRNRKKHQSPKQDLEKAIHYVEKAQALYLAGVKKPRREGSLVLSVEDFAKANGLTEEETEVVYLLANWKEASDLQDAIELIQDMIGEVTN